MNGYQIIDCDNLIADGENYYEKEGIKISLDKPLIISNFTLTRNEHTFVTPPLFMNGGLVTKTEDHIIYSFNAHSGFLTVGCEYFIYDNGDTFISVYKIDP